MLASLPQILAIVGSVISLGQMALHAGQDATPYFNMIKKLFAKEKITEDDIKNLQFQLLDLHNQIQKPLSPEED